MAVNVLLYMSYIVILLDIKTSNKQKVSSLEYKRY